MNLDKLGYSFEEQIFFGVITLYLYECTGKFFYYDQNNVLKEELNKINIEKALINMKPLSYININYEHIYLPCIPDTGIKILNSDKKIEKNIPFSFINPLIKSNISFSRQSDEFKNLNKYAGIMSGERSALIKGKSGKVYRFKGCGSFKNGFTLLENENEKIFKKIEIRGCQFENNVIRELYYTDIINEILKKNNIVPCNIPIGYYKYDNDLKFLDNSLANEDKINNEIPEVDKYCSIYETLGDRRLGTHLLKGLQFLLDSITEAAIKEFNMDICSYNNIKKIFYAKKRKNIESIFTVEQVFIPEGMSLKEWCSKPIYKKEYYTNLIENNYLKELLNTHEEIVNIKKASNLIESWSEIFKKKINFKVAHFEILINELKSMKDKLKEKSILEYIIDIFARIGYETAKIKRIFLDEEFNWGTFNGQSPLDKFCSAHFNNFVVLPPQYNCLLSPIDFDLAFMKKNFVNNDKRSNSYGIHDELLFDKYMNREINTLLNNIINSDDKRYLNENSNGDIKEEIKYVIYYLLNDSLIEYFMMTFDKIESKNLEKYDSSNNIFNILIKLCLISTYDRLS